MQRLILRHKNEISFVSLFLIVSAFISHYLFNNELIAEIALIIASIIGIIPIAIQAYQSLRVKVVSIDVLVTIAVIGAFLIKNFEESAIVTLLFLFGSFLEQRTLNKTRSAIKELTQMAPDVAYKLMKDHEFHEVDIRDVEINDTLLDRTGANVPVDGQVISGSGYVNEASITGESVPVKKEMKNKVYAGTILENGTIKIVAQKVGEDTTFGKIIELVEEAQDSKSKTEKFIDRFSKYYTPLVLLIGIIVYLIWRDIELAITVLVLGCPGALVIGVPVSNVAGIGNGARHGILLKGSETINDFSKVDVFVFDKTGTLTIGRPIVSSIKSYGNNYDRDLSYLKAVEKESDHPLAKAITSYITSNNNNLKVEDTKVIKGGGITASINNDEIVVGNVKLLESKKIEITNDMFNFIKVLEDEGSSIVITAVNNKIVIIMGIKDQIRSDVLAEINKLKR